MGEHEAAVEAAERTNRALGKLFAQMGSTQHPSGAVMRAYRVARAALRGRTNDPRLVREVLAELRRSLQGSADALLTEARALGTEQARADLERYGLPTPPAAEAASGTLQLDLRAAWLATVDAQASQVIAIARSGEDAALILGDGERVGLLSPAVVLAEGARWLVHLSVAAYVATVGAGVEAAGQEDEYRRQAVAALDERTTNCCLRVHGQVVGLHEPFHLTGTPRYAEHQHHPPFHRYCRTVVALVRAEDVDDPLSQQMRAAARHEREARAVTGGRVEIHPAHARSRRE